MPPPCPLGARIAKHKIPPLTRPGIPTSCALIDTLPPGGACLMRPLAQRVAGIRRRLFPAGLTDYMLIRDPVGLTHVVDTRLDSAALCGWVGRAPYTTSAAAVCARCHDLAAVEENGAIRIPGFVLCDAPEKD